MTLIIEQQVARGIFISDHLKNNAADISSKNMSADEKQIFREISETIALKTLLEEEGKDNEHWHLEF